MQSDHTKNTIGSGQIILNDYNRMLKKIKAVNPQLRKGIKDENCCSSSVSDSDTADYHRTSASYRGGNGRSNGTDSHRRHVGGQGTFLYWWA